MVKKGTMKYSHWELLLMLYQRDKRGQTSHVFQCNKNLLKTFLKNGWVQVDADDMVKITDQGIEDAKQITPLYEFGI